MNCIDTLGSLVCLFTLTSYFLFGRALRRRSSSVRGQLVGVALHSAGWELILLSLAHLCWHGKVE